MMFLLGAVFGAIMMALLGMNKSYDELEVYDVLKEILRTCRRSKVAGDHALARARLIVERVEG